MRDPKRPFASITPGTRSTAHFIRRPNMTIRRFPPPWSVEQQAACFVVRDHDGQHSPMSILRMSRGRRSAAKLLSLVTRRGESQ